MKLLAHLSADQKAPNGVPVLSWPYRDSRLLIGWGHSRSEWVFPFQLVVLETHSPAYPKMRLGGDLVVSSPSYVDGENERRCSIRTDLLKRKAGEAAKGSHVVGCSM